MAYYHTYRPKVFAELVGQDHIRRTLQNALVGGQLSHAYLFAGPKGSGKTTTARLLARAVNCLNLSSNQSPATSRPIEPCNACEICQDILQGRSLDVIEIDAASNRGIDDIRSLRDTIALAPAKARQKIFIIDEVHMLTREAFNALLKTLEEPPAHVLFIFATTEPDRVPETILSRIQRFDFKRARVEEIVNWLRLIAGQEKIQVESEALALIAGRSAGAFRDAAVLLEQVVGRGIEPVTEAIIEQTIGLAPAQLVASMAENIETGQVKAVMAMIDQSIGQGVDSQELTRQLIGVFRTRLRAKPQAELLIILEELFKAQSAIRWSPIPQLPLEVAIVSIANQLGQPSPAEEPVNLSAWPKVVAALKAYNHSLMGIVRLAQIVSESDTTITLSVPFKFHQDRIMEAKNKKVIEQTLSQVFARPIQVECLVDDRLRSKLPVDDGAKLAEEAEALFS